ncbi:MAG: hypothetical protein KJZ73_16435 [Pseudorhodoplanes sp.]|nr:hypothetical protein [Pseudorhodoplanes sp.]MCL4712831.1 hypothetical protein [Pseudorhodoplanes sp.]GIK80863.1 MAG: hypothetical protein BroJett024_19680 [Alphaproteobacteria bacterium]
MDTLHTVLRSIRGGTKTRDHLSVFREFLSHLDRVGRRAPPRDVKARGDGVRRNRTPKR